MSLPPTLLWRPLGREFPGNDLFCWKFWACWVHICVWDSWETWRKGSSNVRLVSAQVWQDDLFASPAVPSQKKPFLTEVSGNWNVLVEVWAMGISPGCVRQLGYLGERVQQHQIGHFKVCARRPFLAFYLPHVPTAQNLAISRLYLGKSVESHCLFDVEGVLCVAGGFTVSTAIPIVIPNVVVTRSSGAFEPLA